MAIGLLDYCPIVLTIFSWGGGDTHRHCSHMSPCPSHVKSYVSYKIQLPGWVDLTPWALIIGLYWPIGPLTAEVSTSKVVKAMTHQYPTRLGRPVDWILPSTWSTGVDRLI